MWSQREALAIADAVRGKAASVKDESKPTTQASGLLYDLTSLQREANGRFGFSAKTTLQLAQSLYERHKALTYPRTDSRALPEDYLPTVKQTFEMLADSGMKHLAPHALTALNNGYIRPSKRIFDNSKVSDHFAIIPTLQAPSGLSDAEQKLYDLVVRRFLAVFFPSAEFMVTTRITSSVGHHFKTEGKVLVKPGWMAVYGKEAAEDVADAKEGDKGQNLVPVREGETVRTESVESKGLKTKPPARYSEATLLGAMEGAGKLVDDDELREAMQEKGLGTPATRAATIEGLLTEKYMFREGREIIPTAKAFQLMTLLRGLGVEELSKAELTGEWEYKLAQMEHGKLSRSAFMAEIAQMTERMVKKAKEYDRDTIPGNYATLATPCPNCGGVVKENYRRYTCTGADGASEGCGFSFGKSPAGRTFEPDEVRAAAARQEDRPARRFPLQGGLALRGRDRAQVQRGRQELEAGVRLWRRQEERRKRRDRGLQRQRSAGRLPQVRRRGARARQQLRVHPLGAHRAAAHAQLRLQERQDHPAAAGGARADEQAAGDRQDRSARQVRLHAHAPRVQGLPGLGRGSGQGELRVRAVQVPAAQDGGRRAGQGCPGEEGGAKAKAAPAKKAAAKKTPAVKAAKAPRKTTAATGKQPSAALVAVIGEGAVSRPEVVKKLWDYIKANGLQDAADKRRVNADAKLAAVFGKPQVTMFEIAGLLSPHLN